MSVKLADNFQIREHSWPCLFHIIMYAGMIYVNIINVNILLLTNL